MRIKYETKHDGEDWELQLTEPAELETWTGLPAALIRYGAVGSSVTQVDGRITRRYTLVPDPVKKQVIRKWVNGVFSCDLPFPVEGCGYPLVDRFFAGPDARAVGDYIEYRLGTTYRYELVEVDE